MTWPIAVISFNRPQLLEQVLRGLRDQTIPPNPESVYLFQDGGPQSAPECVSIFKSVFPHGREFVADSNLGIALNIDRAERFAFETLGAECGIFFEDDLVPGPHYLAALQPLIDFALNEPRIAYVAAYGNHKATLDEQKRRRSEVAPMAHKWGFALTRRRWLRQRPIVDPYLDIIRQRPYARRDSDAIRAYFVSLGYECRATSQDACKDIASHVLGTTKIMTFACFARYVGRDGVHFRPAIFDRLGYGSTVLFYEPPTIAPPTSDFLDARIAAERANAKVGQSPSAAQRAEVIAPAAPPHKAAATTDDVRRAYRLILGREAESDDVVQARVGMPIGKLRDALISSREFVGNNRALIEKLGGHALLVAKLVEACQRGPARIVIGAGPTRYEGWCETNTPWLDLTRSEHWDFYFSRHGIQAALMEHVLEHLTPEDAERGLRNVFRYLVPGGHLRIAVPDGHFPDPAYIEWVRPGGNGPGAKDHKVLWTIDTLAPLLEQVGFQTRPLEYFRPDGSFFEHVWSATDGPIARSRHNDNRNCSDAIKYTSLIIDAVRPS